MKQILQNHKISVNRRLRLFYSTVGSVVLYGCESWTPRAEELRALEVTRRAMLRRIVGTRRFPEEEWLNWIQRVTRKAVAMAVSQNVRNWQWAHFKSKWLWAGHVARRPTTIWVWRVTTWRDDEWQELASTAGLGRPLRPSRRRWMKWEDALRRFCDSCGAGEWKHHAQQRDNWSTAAESFATSCCSVA